MLTMIHDDFSEFGSISERAIQRNNKSRLQHSTKESPVVSCKHPDLRFTFAAQNSAVFLRQRNDEAFKSANIHDSDFVIGTLFSLFFPSSLFFALCIGSALFPNRKCFDCFAGRVAERACLVMSVCGRRQMSSGEQKEDIN
jgi:hypothetical protein